MPSAKATNDQQPKRELAAIDGEPGAGQDHEQAEQGVERMLALEHQRLAGDQALQLGEGDDRAGERDGADRRAQRHFDQARELDARVGARLAMPKAAGLDSAAAATNTAARPTRLWNAATSWGSAVIWMRAATTVPIAPPISSADGDRDVVDDAGLGHGGDDRDHHADHAETVAPARRDRRGQPAQRQDEAHRGDQIEEGGEFGSIMLRYFFCAIAGVFLLEHRQHAVRDDEAAEDVDRRQRDGDQAPITWRSDQPAGPAASSAPTMITDETALVTAISGECSAGVTRHTT